MMNYKLGTLEASEALIKDLYIDLRIKVNEWSKITNQTPQARMGYIGQHLVSIVTGYKGGKSGARGYDLVMEDGKYGEIKTCYRVDQLGICKNCNAAVSSLETVCSNCGSANISRKDDSKWLISLRNENEFEKVIEPEKYYFVLFEFEDILSSIDNSIIASIWEVDPKNKGFAYCMIDYFLNIKPNSASKAPFNMWPHQFKFLLAKPRLIYQSRIETDGTINTNVFPTLNNCVEEKLETLTKYSRAKTISLETIKRVIVHFSPNEMIEDSSKKDCLKLLEDLRKTKAIPNGELCDVFADEVYLPLIIKHKAIIPAIIKKYFEELN